MLNLRFHLRARLVTNLFAYSACLFCLLHSSDAFASGDELSPEPEPETITTDQRYTGSLVSPSGTMPAGLLDIEPYFTYSEPAGYFRANGNVRPMALHQHTLANTTLYKYGITDRLSLQTFTIASYGWKDGGTSTSGIKYNDMPVDLIYQFVQPKPEHFIPALSILTGVLFPTGDYKNLSRDQDGVGNGAYVFRTALIEQSTYLLPNRHNLRVRAWATFRRALSSAQIEGISSYGTSTGFIGKGRPGMNGQSGFSVEYGLNKSWVLACDLARDWANGAHVRGRYANGAVVNQIKSSAGDWLIAPAVEYSWSPRFGVIMGTSIYFAGHNVNMTISPQVAVNTVFW